MLSGIARCFVLVLTVTVIHAQDQSGPTFEVASVKRSTGDGTAGGVRAQPNGITATDASLVLLLRVAYNVQDYQIVGTRLARARSVRHRCPGCANNSRDLPTH